MHKEAATKDQGVFEYDAWFLSTGRKKHARIFLTLLLCVIAFYFRTFLAFEEPAGLKKENARLLAEKMVKARMAEQIKDQLPPQALQNSEGLQAALEQKVEELAQKNRDFYLQAVRNTEQAISSAQEAKPKKHYLLEADPYFYLYLTENVLRTGKVAEKISSGLYLNPLRNAPDGRWDRLNLSPYFGAGIYKFFQKFNPSVSLMEALSWAPVFLVMLIVIIQQLCYKLLRFGPGESFLGGFLFILSPIFLQRSLYGWYDTDPWIFLFSIPITALFLRAILISRFSWIFLGIAGVASAFFIFFWSGCSFLFILISTSGFGASVVCGIKNFKEGKDVFRKTIFYLVIALASFYIFVPSKLLWDTLLTSVSFVLDAASPDSALWPTGLLTTGETKSTTLIRLIFLTGSVPSFLLALSGFVLLWRCVFKKQEFYEMKIALFLTAMTIPLLILGLKVERFSLLFVLPLAFWYPLGLYFTSQWIQKLFTKQPNPNSPLTTNRIIVLILIFSVMPLIVIPNLFLARNRQTTIMNDAWYEALKEAERKTPEDAIIHSWWPPGHFITGVAHRRVVIDGGSQDLPQIYWIARAFMTDDEKQSIGFLRLSATSGNKAYEFLRSKDFRPSQAVEIISSVVGRSRNEAKKILEKNLSKVDARSLLALTHGIKEPAPSYLLVYNELVEQNLAVTIVSQWDFEVAEMMRKKKASEKERMKTILGMSGGVLRYEEEGQLINKEGNKLIFSNGLIVDWDSKEAIVQKGGNEGKPESLFFETENGVSEKTFSGLTAHVSAMVFQKNGVPASLIANRKLIRSMLFRLYYFNGKGLQFFHPMIEKNDHPTRTVVKIFSYDDPEFKRSDHA